MNSINWKTKLTSRKFWVAVVGFVTPLLIAFGFTDGDITKVVAVIMGGATLIAYILGEGLVDSSRAKSETVSTSTITTIKAEESINLKAEANGVEGNDDGKG